MSRLAAAFRWFAYQVAPPRPRAGGQAASFSFLSTRRPRVGETTAAAAHTGGNPDEQHR